MRRAWLLLLAACGGAEHPAPRPVVETALPSTPPATAPAPAPEDQPSVGDPWKGRADLIQAPPPAPAVPVPLPRIARFTLPLCLAQGLGKSD